jgi:ammonia channel protein AmtB
MDFASVLSDFGLSVTPSCTEILLDLYRKSKLLIALQICTVCFFQTVFAATADNCIRGNRRKNKFSTYLIFSFDDRFIYPISGHWVWQGEGWLTNLGFIDFAGSTVVHSVGGYALVAAIMVGPRIGKYTDGKSNAIPGTT